MRALPVAAALLDIKVMDSWASAAARALASAAAPSASSSMVLFLDGEGDGDGVSQPVSDPCSVAFEDSNAEMLCAGVIVALAIALE